MISSRVRVRGKSLSKVDEIAFRAWAEEGSLDKAKAYFMRKKILRDTGRPFSVMGIRYCAMRYMITHYDESLGFLSDEYRKRGMIPSTEAIEVTMIGYAVEVLRYKNDVIEWTKEHELYDKYQSIIEEKTRNAPLETRRTSLARQLQREVR